MPNLSTVEARIGNNYKESSNDYLKMNRIEVVWGTQTPCPFSTGDLFTEAADAAMEAMKGRLANQYYMKAEEAWSAMEEWKNDFISPGLLALCVSAWNMFTSSFMASFSVLCYPVLYGVS